MLATSLKIKRAEREGTCGKMAASTKEIFQMIARMAKAA